MLEKNMMHEQITVVNDTVLDLTQGGRVRQMKIHPLLRFSLALYFIFGLAVCGACRKSTPAPARPAHEGVTGVVVSVDKDQGTIQINHEEIKGYMPAMSMAFHVKKKFLLDDIKPGDKVQFTLRDTGNGYVISQLKKQ
jgi:Cu/Ag efflux protein CusF